MRSDNDGWDDSFDEFREEHPAHPIQSVGELVPKDLLRPWAKDDAPQPLPKQVKCGKCFKQFTAKPVWFCAKWNYSAVCLECSDGNTLPPGFLAECKRPPVRRMSCRSCGITRGIEATLRHNLWEYELICPNCGDYAIYHSRIRRTCASCAEDFYVSETHPIRLCAGCYQAKSGSVPHWKAD